MKGMLNLGIDIGSTTVKILLMNENNDILYSSYKRHLLNIQKTLVTGLMQVKEMIHDKFVSVTITGSGGMELAKKSEIPFLQEVVCSYLAVSKFYENIDVILELGGEDAKITYLTGQIEQRMNGTCAGGTGAFIDQMAILLGTDAKGLNELAEKGSIIYPIAARCGVFAKSDIQPLLNEGVRKEDIALSIFQAVVIQTISVLACGHPIKGRVAFVGGPLTFLPELRRRFTEVLKLKAKDIITPKYSQVFAALGACLNGSQGKVIDIDMLINDINSFYDNKSHQRNHLEPLFVKQEDYKLFKEKHEKCTLDVGNIEETKGYCFLGIDAGSTTTKAVLIDENDNILYKFYSNNLGKPIDCVKTILKEVYSKLPHGCRIANSLATGYGECLIKAAFHIDEGEVETIAHYKAAKKICDNVDFILDIGGQDMKCIRIKDGIIDDILLNEACSSGCGSFLETFAESINIGIEDFCKSALQAKRPTNLGTRCTVFMNSKVKQAQRDGADLDDVAAGLCYSVIKNALFKVIKIKNMNELGENIVVQGGTFKNDAVLRCFELLTSKNVIRSDMPEMMGAFGAALLAKERYDDKKVSSVISLEALNNINLTTKTVRCNKCSNNCLLTINNFGNKEFYISGNRCEKGVGREVEKDRIPNIYDYKYKRVFDYIPLSTEEAKNGVIGIPRVLNFYENYPFWFTFFTELKFKVELSEKSSREIYQKGIETIPSESACYPAKIVHGHITDLIEKGVSTIFYPCLMYEKNDDKKVGNCFNCPVITSYSELIKNNVEQIDTGEVLLINPFLSYENTKKLKKQLFAELEVFNLTKTQIDNAVNKAIKEQEKYKTDVQKKGEEILVYLERNNKEGIVLGSKPYHIDPEINHGIDKLINSLGMAVLSEDAIMHLSKLKRPLRVFDQWSYQTRLYKAAQFVTTRDYLNFVQLNSFGCGLDAISESQIQEILKSGDKVYTCLKIDEGTSLGSAKIRLRSLKALIMNNKREKTHTQTKDYVYKKTKSGLMSQRKHTIFAPQFSPIHFTLVESGIRTSGYDFVVLKNEEGVIEEGLKYVNNDMCYPAIVVIGQMVKYVKENAVDPHNVSLMIVQTGGGCRFTNYITSLRKALEDAGYGYVPVISLNSVGLEFSNMFKATNPKMLFRLANAIFYSDVLSKCLYHVRANEKEKGTTQALFDRWMDELKKRMVKDYGMKAFKETLKEILCDFEKVELKETPRPKVGVVGESYVKLNTLANNGLIKMLENNGVEVVLHDYADFFLRSAYNGIYRWKNMSSKVTHTAFCKMALSFLQRYQKAVNEVISNNSNYFNASCQIHGLAEKAKEIIQIGNQAGEGWMIAAEVIDLLERGINNIVLVQPFACLPGHIIFKGIMKKIKQKYPQANMVAIEFDAGASEANQINRIKLMLANIKGNSNI